MENACVSRTRLQKARGHQSRRRGGLIRAAGGEDSEDLRGARSDPGTKGPLLTVAESLVELCHTHVWKAEPVTGADDYLARRFPARC